MVSEFAALVVEGKHFDMQAAGRGVRWLATQGNNRPHRLSHKGEALRLEMAMATLVFILARLTSVHLPSCAYVRASLLQQVFGGLCSWSFRRFSSHEGESQTASGIAGKLHPRPASSVSDLLVSIGYQASQAQS